MARRLRMGNCGSREVPAVAVPERTALVIGGDFNSCSWVARPSAFDPLCPPGGMPSGVYALLTRGTLPPSHPDSPRRRHKPGASVKAAAKHEGFTAVPHFPELGSSGLQLRSAYKVLSKFVEENLKINAAHPTW